MISDTSLIKNIVPINGNVMIANGDKIPIRGIGSLKLFDKETKAFYMPEFTSNLLSVKKCATDLQCNVIFSPNDVKFQDIKSSKMIGKGVTKGELYLLEDLAPVSSYSCSFTSVSGSSLSKNALWHARLGHPHNKALKLMLPGVSFENNDCEACILGKHCKTVFTKSTTVYEKCFDLIHSDRFWSDAVTTACYLINRTPTLILQGLSPFEVLNRYKPSLEHMKIFGCLCFVMVPGELRNKLEARSSKAMFVGYSSSQKGYKCYDPNTRRVLVSREVKFVEEKGYYEEQIQEDLKDLTSDRAATLRIILEGLGINMDQEQQEVRGTTPIPNHQTSNLEHEGGNGTETQTQSHEESSGSHDQAVESNDQQEGAEASQLRDEGAEASQPREESTQEGVQDMELPAQEGPWDNFFMPTPMRFIQLPGDSPPLYISKSSFLQRDSSWFDWNDEEAVLFPNWETGIT
ncbi:hypothetical protein Bca4012_102626 [Brassica carinata]